MDVTFSTDLYFHSAASAFSDFENLESQRALKNAAEFAKDTDTLKC